MRILHTESSVHMGGQELRVLMEIEALSRYGFMSVLAAGPGAEIVGEARLRGLEVYTVPMHGSFDPAAVFRFVRIIREEGIDLVSAHGSKDGWSAGLAARLTGIKVVRSRHVANPIRRHCLGRMVYGILCDRIVTTSEFIRAGMVERGVPAQKIVSIPTGVDTAMFHPGIEKGLFRRELGIEDEVPLVGMVSVLRGDKGPDVFIRAAESVLARSSGIMFALVGDGWMRGILEKMVLESPYREKIILTGFRRDIPFVLADLNLLVLSARIPEGVPQTILQAHAMEVPVIASDVGGIKEAALHGKNALCVPPGDPEVLAETILHVLENKEEAGRRAKEGRNMVLAGYTRQMTLDRMRSVYSSVLES